MLICKWEELPVNMQTDEIRKYYDMLKKKQKSLVLKRLFDIWASLILIIILSPLFILLGVIIKIDSKGPIFYRQIRMTQYAKEFYIHKFRTMIQDADKGSLVTVENDSRITRVGKIIRKYRVDEIPQLIDILWGNMTFVGTRPEVRKYVDMYSKEMMATLLLPAGVTSKASICYKDEAEILDNVLDVDLTYKEKILPIKMHYNLNAIDTFCLKNDIKIIVMTICSVFFGMYYGEESKTVYEKI